jgi:hypothetical protein
MALWCSTVSTGSGFGRGHDGQHAPQDPVAASRLSFARRTDGKLATARHGTEIATPASVGVVISPCREGTVAVGFTSGKGGLGFPSGGWFFPVDTPRRRLTVSARGSQRWMSREERGTRSCRAPREPRKRSTEFSAALLPVPGHGRSDSVRPRMAIGGRHWVGGGPCCGLPNRFRKEPTRQATASPGLGANRRSRLRLGRSNRVPGPENVRRLRLSSANGTSQGASEALSD